MIRRVCCSLYLDMIVLLAWYAWPALMALEKAIRCDGFCNALIYGRLGRIPRFYGFRGLTIPSLPPARNGRRGGNGWTSPSRSRDLRPGLFSVRNVARPFDPDRPLFSGERFRLTVSNGVSLSSELTFFTCCTCNNFTFPPIEG